MKNIDTDFRLLIPEKTNLLLFGGNFLFAKRLYEIIKRDLEIKRIDFKKKSSKKYFTSINNRTFKIEIESIEKIKGLLNYYNSNTLIITSEIFLILEKKDYLKMIDLLKEIKKQTKTKIIFIAINNPLHIFEKNKIQKLSNMQKSKWYFNRIKEAKNILNRNDDLIFEFSSYYTYTCSNLQINPIEIIQKKKLKIYKNENNHTFSLHFADDIIKFINDNFKKTNIILFDDHNNKTTLDSFCKEFKNNNVKFSNVINQCKCALNLIYRKKSNEIVNSKSIAYWRFKLGESLKNSIPEEIVKKIDLIVPIPETGKYYAQGLAQALNKIYAEPFFKKNEIGRSFDIQNYKKREKFINDKIGIIKDFVDNKTIGIVDEAIFTGATLKFAVKLLKNTNVKEIYLFIPSPEYKNICKYNLQPHQTLLLKKLKKDKLIKYFGVNGIFFQNIESFKQIIDSCNYNVCCFSNQNE